MRIKYHEQIIRDKKEIANRFVKCRETRNTDLSNCYIKHYDPEKDTWNNSFEEFQYDTRIHLHYLLPGFSNWLGKGGYKSLVTHDDKPHYLLYRTKSTNDLNLYTFDVSEDICEDDWHRYIKVHFGRRISIYDVLDNIYTTCAGVGMPNIYKGMSNRSKKDKSQPKESTYREFYSYVG